MSTAGRSDGLEHLTKFSGLLQDLGTESATESIPILFRVVFIKLTVESN